MSVIRSTSMLGRMLCWPAKLGKSPRAEKHSGCSTPRNEEFAAKVSVSNQGSRSLYHSCSCPTQLRKVLEIWRNADAAAVALVHVIWYLDHEVDTYTTKLLDFVPSGIHPSHWRIQHWKILKVFQILMFHSAVPSTAGLSYTRFPIRISATPGAQPEFESQRVDQKWLSTSQHHHSTGQEIVNVVPSSSLPLLTMSSNFELRCFSLWMKPLYYICSTQLLGTVLGRIVVLINSATCPWWHSLLAGKSTAMCNGNRNACYWTTTVSIQESWVSVIILVQRWKIEFVPYMNSVCSKVMQTPRCEPDAAAEVVLEHVISHA